MQVRPRLWRTWWSVLLSIRWIAPVCPRVGASTRSGAKAWPATLFGVPLPAPRPHRDLASTSHRSIPPRRRRNRPGRSGPCSNRFGARPRLEQFRKRNVESLSEPFEDDHCGICPRIFDVADVGLIDFDDRGQLLLRELPSLTQSSHVFGKRHDRHGIPRRKSLREGSPCRGFRHRKCVAPSCSPRITAPV